MGERGEIMAPKSTRARQDKGITLLHEGIQWDSQLQIGGCGAASAATPRWCRNMFEAKWTWRWTWVAFGGDSFCNRLWIVVFLPR